MGSAHNPRAYPWRNPPGLVVRPLLWRLDLGIFAIPPGKAVPNLLQANIPTFYFYHAHGAAISIGFAAVRHCWLTKRQLPKEHL